MKLNIGIKLRVTTVGNYVRESTKVVKTGVIESITRHLVVINYGDYKESFNRSDLISQRDYKLEVKEDGKWVQIRKVN